MSNSSGRIPTVVNVKKGEVCDVIIMRGHHVGPGSVANQYQIGPDGDREEVIRKYAYDFQLKWRTEPEFRESVLNCMGKRLGCCCKPEMCHGDVIALFLEAMLESGERAACNAMLEIASGNTVYEVRDSLFSNSVSETSMEAG